MKGVRGSCIGWRLGMLLAFLLPLSTVRGADETAELLPRDPALWLNSPPLTSESLKGKGVFLWFFEEECPRCRGKWPSLYELANRYTGKPVVFIAVNSGNPPNVVQQYAREVKLNWPIIVDTNRQYEKLWCDHEISLQNIYQLGLILPSGRKREGDWDDLEGSVAMALRGASWKIDPKTIPAAFLPTWQAVEFGNYPAAASLLKKGLVTKNTEVKEAAERVHAYVQNEIKTAVEQAAKARQDGDSWRAFQTYQGMNKTFAGYELPAEVTMGQKELVNDPQVKRELEAAKLLDGIQKSFLTARTDVARKRVSARLEELIAKYAGTDAAKQAQQVIGRNTN